VLCPGQDVTWIVPSRVVAEHVHHHKQATTHVSFMYKDGTSLGQTSA